AIQLLKNNEFDAAIRMANKILQNSPLDSSARLILAMAYLGKGEEKKARSQAERAKKVDAAFSAVIYDSMGKYYSLKKRYYKALIYFQKSLAIKDDPSVVRSMASVYLVQGRLKKARTAYQKILDSQPVYLPLSRIFLMEKDFPNAILYAQKAIQEDPKALNAYLILGTSHLLTGNLDLSEKNFLLIKKINPKFFLASYYLGIINLIQNKYIDSLQHFNNVLLIAPGIKEARLYSIVIRHLMGDYEKAETEALKTIALDTSDSLSHLVLGNIFLSKKDFEGANQSYQSAGGLIPDFELSNFKTSNYFRHNILSTPAYFSLAGIFFREGLYNEVIKAISATEKDAFSENPFFMLLKARAYARLGQFDEAQRLYNFVVKKNPEIVGSYVDLGDLAVFKGDIKKAIEFYKEAIKHAPSLAKLHLSLGDLYNTSDNSKKAIIEYQRVVSLAPNWVPGYNQLAWTLAEKKNRYQEAIPYALKGIALDPGHVDMIDTLAFIYMRLGKYSEAGDLYSKINPMKINNPSIYYHMGLAYKKADKYKKAIEFFERALNISDEFTEAAETKLMLIEMTDL
ncbi:MAG: tetratricopeptide repeat protein, partial [Deltaproteobacteria bacterium]|nr:tetratricopeptide repeat protein [Deltaproteobacteria bacterium]